MRLRHFLIIKKRFLRARRRAFVSGLAGNGGMLLPADSLGISLSMPVCAYECVTSRSQHFESILMLAMTHISLNISHSVGVLCRPSTATSQTLRAVLKHRCRRDAVIQAEAAAVAIARCLFGAQCQRGSYSAALRRHVSVQYARTQMVTMSHVTRLPPFLLDNPRQLAPLSAGLSH